MRYTDEVFVNAANTLRAPGNTLIDALVEVPVKQRLTLRLNITNLTDETYVRNVNNNGGRYNPGNPRAFLLSTVFRFQGASDSCPSTRPPRATLFLVEPDEYDGGDLVVEDTYGLHAVKLPAGHLVLYPSTSLHHVTPVTRGSRVCSFFWIQSLVRDDGRRTLLFEMDTAIQSLARDVPSHAAVVRLTGVYHNLLRTVGGAVNRPTHW